MRKSIDGVPVWVFEHAGTPLFLLALSPGPDHSQLVGHFR